MTCLDYEKPGKSIELLVALVIPDVGAFALGDDRDVVAFKVGRVPGEVHPEMVASFVSEMIIA